MPYSVVAHRAVPAFRLDFAHDARLPDALAALRAEGRFVTGVALASGVLVARPPRAGGDAPRWLCELTPGPGGWVATPAGRGAPGLMVPGWTRAPFAEIAPALVALAAAAPARTFRAALVGARAVAVARYSRWASGARAGVVARVDRDVGVRVRVELGGPGPVEAAAVWCRVDVAPARGFVLAPEALEVALADLGRALTYADPARDPLAAALR